MDKLTANNFDDFIFDNINLENEQDKNPFVEVSPQKNYNNHSNHNNGGDIEEVIVEDDLDKFLKPADKKQPQKQQQRGPSSNNNNNNNNNRRNTESKPKKTLDHEEDLKVPVSIRVKNDDGLLVELIEDYITQREKEPDKLLGKVLGATKENKLEAANKLRLLVESGESLTRDLNTMELINSQKDRLGQVFTRYKEERLRLHNRMKAARQWALNERPNWLEYGAVPVSIHERETEVIDLYITRRENDPRETKSFGSQILAVIWDGYTRTGKLRAARLLKKAIESGAPLGLVHDEESTALDSNSELGVIFTRYSQEQERIRRRMKTAQNTMRH